MPGPWRRLITYLVRASCVGFNLNRDARPLATQDSMSRRPENSMFQSQPRCQAPGDLSDSSGNPVAFVGFNLNRDARPLATLDKFIDGVVWLWVSISTEMPGPWRHWAS